MRVLVVTSCTGEKACSPEHQLRLADFKQGAPHLQLREKELRKFMTPAGSLYTGDQHVRLMRGISALRSLHSAAVLDLFVLSAGYGLIPETRKIAPYECTFATMKAKEIRAWSEALHVPSLFRKTIAAPYDIALILLGDSYLQACRLAEDVKFAGFTLLFCGRQAAKQIPRLPNLRVVTLSNSEAQRFSCGLVGLKGEIASRLLSKLASETDLVTKLKDPATDILALLDTTTPTKPARNGKPSLANSAVDHVIHIPQSWWSKPHREQLSYFIPEWDDMVDPDFDFLSEEHSGGSGDWSNNVYAHQLYPEPNYDGILVSRAIAESNRKKKERINALGVHRFLRVPRGFPIMGDCGAFDYIAEKEPPYTTQELLEYYTRLDFDYGVSIDHLIVPAFESERDFRYQLTVHNAEEFLKQHRKARLAWEPIGAVQGWDPTSYAEAAASYVRMGYKYLALGSLVPKKSKDILKIVAAVRGKIPPQVKMHAFGVARLDSVEAFSRAGIQTVDSASYLRQAWMRLHHGYATLTGPFSALRIPQAGKSFRAKRMEEHAGLTEQKILALERSALRAVRDVAEHHCSVDTCLNALLEYDRFVTAERVDMANAYRRTLEHRPWEACDCAICKKWGVEVIIFRGNNRNRRRGFHNTFVFYRLFQKALRGEDIPFIKSLAARSSQLDLPSFSEAILSN